MAKRKLEAWCPWTALALVALLLVALTCGIACEKKVQAAPVPAGHINAPAATGAQNCAACHTAPLLSGIDWGERDGRDGSGDCPPPPPSDITGNEPPVMLGDSGGGDGDRWSPPNSPFPTSPPRAKS